MKTREGFVSNSSSSSFCIYGAALEKMAFSAEFLGKVRAKILSGYWEWESDDDMMDDDTLIDWIEGDEDSILEVIDDDTPLEVYNVDGYRYAGMSPDSIQDNETGAQFKARVKSALESMGVTDQPSWIQETWYS